MGREWPTVKYQVMITVLGLGDEWLLSTMGEGREDDDCQPFLNFTKVCPLHYLQSVCFYPILAILFVVHKLFFFLKGLKIQIKFHYSSAFQCNLQGTIWASHEFHIYLCMILSRWVQKTAPSGIPATEEYIDCASAQAQTSTATWVDCLFHETHLSTCSDTTF